MFAKKLGSIQIIVAPFLWRLRECPIGKQLFQVINTHIEMRNIPFSFVLVSYNSIIVNSSIIFFMLEAPCVFEIIVKNNSPLGLGTRFISFTAFIKPCVSV